MSSNTFTLFQNEGYLMQGCLKAGLCSILTAPNAQPAPFYAAFFNYSIGLERLMKILLLLDKWHRERKFLTDDELKAKGHKLDNLYKEVLPLFKKYGVPENTSCSSDKINADLLNFLSDFATGSRYYNLNALAGSATQNAKNPIFRWQALFYRAYEQDHPNVEPVTNEPDVPEDSMSLSELTRHHVIIAAARPHICWRLVQLLSPLQALLIAICEHVHKDDIALGGVNADPSVPYLEEFLEFVCSDKTAIESAGWPYLD